MNDTIQYVEAACNYSGPLWLNRNQPQEAARFRAVLDRQRAASVPTFASGQPIGDDGVMSAVGGPSWARGVTRIAVLTGAGISTDSGIPDFRGPQGLWTRDPGAERLSTYQAYLADPALRRRSWQARLAHPAWGAVPNAAHTALASLAAVVDTWVITQNIDGLHQRAGTPADRVLELHGTMFGVVCVRCGARSEMARALDRVKAGEHDPPCELCGGILKSATVMFGQALDPPVLARAARAVAGCDLMLAIGSTLTVEPAASLCAVAADTGAHLVIVNRDPTPYDGLAAEVIREPIGSAIPRIAGHLIGARHPPAASPPDGGRPPPAPPA